LSWVGIDRTSASLPRPCGMSDTEVNELGKEKKNPFYSVKFKLFWDGIAEKIIHDLFLYYCWDVSEVRERYANDSASSNIYFR
jgi:hypothetical protein